MRNGKNLLVALLVAVAMFLGLSAVAGPASAAGPGPSHHYNLAVNFMYDHGRITQWVSVYNAKTRKLQNVAASHHSHIVRKGNDFWLRLKSGERVVKGMGDLYYGRYSHGNLVSNLFERYNGGVNQVLLSVKIGHARPKNYQLIEGTVDLIIKGQPTLSG